MGELARQQRSSHGPKLSGLDAAATAIQLPIFGGPVFDPTEHRVPNWIIIPGHVLGTFDGEDQLGWGMHPVGVVDCINLPMCKQFNLKVKQNFGALFTLEATYKEKMLAKTKPQAAFLSLLKRLIVRVKVDLTAAQFIPDPEVFDVLVNLDMSQTAVRNGASGRLVLKSTFISDKVNKARDSLMSKFRKKLDNICPDKVH